MADENAVGTKTDAKEYQKEMMAQQPVNRTQTKSNKAADARDMGSRGAGEVGNMEGQGGQPTREGGKAAAKKI